MTPCFELAEVTVRDGEEDALIAERRRQLRPRCLRTDRR
jgi:hypothetical protein